MDRMYCKKYHADISVQTCISRQEKIGSGFSTGIVDPGCAGCEQGLEVIKKFAPADNMKKSPAAPNADAAVVTEPSPGESGAKTKYCCGPLCKKEVPIEAFGKNNSQPDGLQTTCKKCAKIYYDNSRKKKKTTVPAPAKQAMKKTASKKEPPKAPVQPKPAGKTLTINFTDYPDVFDWLIKTAKEDVRTPEGQVVWMIKDVIAFEKPEDCHNG